MYLKHQCHIEVQELVDLFCTMGVTKKPSSNADKGSSPLKTTPEDQSFTFKGVVYDSYEEMVKAKRQRNADMLAKSGLLEAAAEMKAPAKKSEASKRGLRADRKRKDSHTNLPPRRASSRLRGVQADDIFIADEMRGGKIILGGSGDSSGVLPSGSNVYVEEKKEKFFKNRINDGSPLDVKDAVELTGHKWVKDNSVSSAESFLNDLNLSSKSSDVKNVISPRGVAETISSQISKLNIDSEECVAKVVPDRIYSVAFHPSCSKIVTCAGDKQGYIGLWDVDSTSEETDGVYLFRPHSSPVSNLEWTKCGSKLMSSSYDGTVKLFDITSQKFTQVFASYDESPEFKDKLGYGLDEGHKFWIQYTCFGSTENTLFLSTSVGGVLHVDLRSKGKIAFDLTLSEKKINSIR